MYTCPVCFYSELPNPPEHYEICSCCGTEFGYDDINLTHDELRIKWANSGSKWWSKYIQPTKEYNFASQIIQVLEEIERQENEQRNRDTKQSE